MVIVYLPCGDTQIDKSRRKMNIRNWSLKSYHDITPFLGFARPRAKEVSRCSLVHKHERAITSLIFDASSLAQKVFQVFHTNED